MTKIILDTRHISTWCKVPMLWPRSWLRYNILGLQQHIIWQTSSNPSFNNSMRGKYNNEGKEKYKLYNKASEYLVITTLPIKNWHYQQKLNKSWRMGSRSIVFNLQDEPLCLMCIDIPIHKLKMIFICYLLGCWLFADLISIFFQELIIILLFIS